MREKQGLWIRRVSAALLLVLVGSVVAVGVHRYRILKPQLLKLLPQALTGGQVSEDDAPVGVYTGFEHTESVSGTPVFQIVAAKTLGLESGWYTLEGVALKLYRKGGGFAEVRCDRARFNAKTRAAELEGSVHLQFKEGTFLDTRWGRFDPRTRVFSSSGEVFFGGKGMVGRAGVLEYHLESERVVLRESVRVFGPSGSVLVAPRLLYDRASLQVRFPEGCIVRDGTSLIEAPEGRLVLASPEGAPSEIFLDRGVRLSSRSADGLQELRGAAGRLHLVREGTVMWRGEAGTDGPWVELELTGGPDYVYRRLRTWKLEFVAGPEGPVSAHSTGVTCLLDVPPEGPERWAESESGTYRFEGGALTDMELAGQVRLGGGSTRARSALARFLGRQRLVSLQAGPAATGARVEGEMDGSRIWADEIQLLDGGERVTARGDVQGETTRIGLAGGQEGQAAEVTRFASLDLEALPRRSQMVLRRNARIWQGARLLLADEIRIDESERTLDAEGNVRMTLPPEDEGRDGSGEILVVARTLHYDEDEKLAVFIGGVRLSDAEHTLASAKLSVKVGADGALEGFVAEGQVAVEETGVHRRITGERASYDGAGRVLVVTGSPARLVDEKGNVVTGRSLTWHKADDTVTVAGEEQKPAETIYHPEG